MIDLSNYDYHQEPFENYQSTKSFSENVYRTLHKTFPSLEGIISEISDHTSVNFTKEQNRIDINLQLIEFLSLDNSWIDLIKQTTTLDFFHDLCDKFNLDKSKYISISNRHENKDTDIEGDFQFAYNVKNNFKKTQYIRPPHIDSSNKIFVILMYFPEKMDTTYNSETDFGYLRLYKRIEQCLTPCNKINYDHNSSIIFKNSINAVHAPYSLINHSLENRRFVNIIYSDKKHKCF